MIEMTVVMPIGNSFTKIMPKGNWLSPDTPIGLVIFALGNGSDKSSLRNHLISRILIDNNIDISSLTI